MWVNPLISSFLLACCCFGLATADEQPKLVVVTVGTELTDGLKRLLSSAESFDVPIEVLALGEKWNGGDTRYHQGGGQKIRILVDWIRKYKDQPNTIILFVDAYDVVFNANPETILRRFFEHFEDKKVVFGAEPFCWPDEKLAPDYPIVEFGKRYLNSGLFIGYAPELYRILSFREVQDGDDDQLYYTLIYLDEKLRKELKIGLDSMSKLFQNLNGVVDDVELQFSDDGEAQAYNAAYNTHPVIIHGNGPSKKHLNYLANYVGNRWHAKTGCTNCGDKSQFSFEGKSEDEHPLIAINFFVAKPVPFVEEVLQSIAALDYPKKKIALYIYNSQKHNIKTIMDFLAVHGKEYYTKKVINGVTEIGERDARNEALSFNAKFSVDYALFIDGDAYLTNPRTIKNLVEYSVNYDIGIVAPLLTQFGKVFANFWGALASNGYYLRSEDYMAIVQGKRVGYWNVPFITSIYLIAKDKLDQMKKPFSYNKVIDPDMSLCQWARDNGHFMYVNNEVETGYLIVSDEFAETITEGHYHPEMWQIFENRKLWEARYVHPGYHALLEEGTEVEQACPDVYDYPLMSERYCKEMIEEMEAYGRWSNGGNQDERLQGGYENVPTRDIHMNQIDYARHWLYFLDEYVRPVQEKVFIGYYKKPVDALLMFVARYKPEEQPALRPHHDASTFSIDVALNKKNVDYEGGGVRYLRYNCTVPADEVGHAMMFPGRLTHLHEGLPTTKGTRYILVSFINP